MHLLYVLSFFLAFSHLQAQQVFPADRFTGRPYQLITYDNIRGDAYLFQDWKPGRVMDFRGYIYTDLQLRFDLYNNRFTYLSGGNIYEFAMDVREVELIMGEEGNPISMIFRKGFGINDRVTPETFVQVLAGGKVMAVKHLYKRIVEATEYNVPGKVKSFEPGYTWFFSSRDTWVSQKPSAKLLQELVKDKWDAVKDWMSQNGLQAKKEADFVAALQYYNSLFP